jgi:predicted dehydrogenase/threonine dehydrogenase-like Zn-dependent dehydrogenase
MKQIVQNYRSGELALRETPAPALQPGGVIVQTLFSAVSVGTEGMKVRTARQSLVGKARARPDLVKQVLATYRREGLGSTYRKVMNRLDTPVPLGYSSAGRVVEAAPGVDLAIGDLVACAGAGHANHAEFAFVPQNLCVRVPDGVALPHAAFATIGSIALHGVRQADVQVGETVCVVGLGLVGLLAVQVLRAAGCRVFGVDLNRERIALARTLGASAGLPPEASGLDQEVAAFTRGLGFDVAIVAAADPGSRAIGLAARAVRDRGRVVVLGIVGMDLDHKLFYDKELDLRMSRSYGPGRYDPAYELEGTDYPPAYVRWTERRNMEAFLDLVRDGQVAVEPLVTHRLPFDRAPQGYELIAGPDGSRVLGLLFEYGEGPHVPSRRVDLQPAARAAKDGAVGVGFVGAGNFARTTLLPAFRETGSRLTGVAAGTSVSARSTGDRFGFAFAAGDASEILRDTATDLVVVATRHDLHAPVTVEALAAGKAVMVEKPLALNEAELLRVADAYRAAPSPFLHVGFNRRFAPLLIQARDFLPASGPRTIDCRVNAGYVPPSHWYHDPQQGGGRLIGEGCHFVDLACWLARSRPVDVYAAAMDDAGLYRGDNVSLLLRFENGSIASVTYVACGDGTLPKELIEVSSGGATAIVDDYRTLTLSRDGVVRKETGRAQDKGHAAQVRAVVDALAGGHPAPVPFEDLLLSMAATFAAARSLAARERVAIDAAPYSGSSPA